MDDITYHILKASVELAKERGPFEKFKESKWSKGWLPIDEFKNEIKELFNKHSVSFEDYHKFINRWNKLREDIIKYGVRFITHFAIAPTSTNSAILGATEGIEPIKKLVINKVGTYNCKKVAPDILKLRNHYQLVENIPNKRLLELASIRQIFLDQGQSINLYYDEKDMDAYKILDEILYAYKLKIKGLYYANSLQGDDEEPVEEESVCDGCQS